MVQLDVWELGPVNEEARKLVWLEVWECSRSGSSRGSKTGSAGGLEDQAGSSRGSTLGSVRDPVRILERFETWFGRRIGPDHVEVWENSTRSW